MRGLVIILRAIRLAADEEELEAARAVLRRDMEANRLAEGVADHPGLNQEGSRGFRAAMARRDAAAEYVLAALTEESIPDPPDLFSEHVFSLTVVDLLRDVPETVALRFLEYARLPMALASGMDPRLARLLEGEIVYLRDAFRSGLEQAADMYRVLGGGEENDPRGPSTDG